MLGRNAKIYGNGKQVRDALFVDDLIEAYVLAIKNIDKAKGIQKARLRAEREPLLAAQDVLFQRAQESGADTTAIVAEKNRLRDITNLVDGCKTTAELRELHC